MSWCGAPGASKTCRIAHRAIELRRSLPICSLLLSYGGTWQAGSDIRAAQMMALTTRTDVGCTTKKLCSRRDDAAWSGPSVRYGTAKRMAFAGTRTNRIAPRGRPPPSSRSRSPRPVDMSVCPCKPGRVPGSAGDRASSFVQASDRMQNQSGIGITAAGRQSLGMHARRSHTLSDGGASAHKRTGHAWADLQE